MEASPLSMWTGVLGGGMSTSARLATTAGGLLLSGFSSATFLCPFDLLVPWTFLDPAFPNAGSFLFLFRCASEWGILLSRHAGIRGILLRVARFRGTHPVKKEKSWCTILSSFDSECDTTRRVFYLRVVIWAVWCSRRLGCQCEPE